MSKELRALIVGLGVLATLLVFVAHETATVQSQQLYALIVAAVGSVTFLAHGGRRVTVAGLYAAATALFIGYSGWVISPIDGATPAMNTVLGASALTLSVSIAFFGDAPRDVSSVRFDGGTYFVVLGVVALAGLYRIRAVSPLFTEAAAYMAVIVVFAALVFGTEKATRWAPILILPLLGVYSLYFHGGSGRLRLVGLLGALELIYSARHAKRWHKVAMVAIVPVGLQLLAAYRIGVQRSASGSTNSGLESMYAPPRAFAALVQAQAENGCPLAWGSSFLTPLFSVVPRSLRPGWVPEAFNYELVALSDPELFNTGFSTAGSWFGEWWWNFGAFGLVLCALVTGRILSLLDRAWTAAVASAPRSRRWALVACGVLAIAGAVGDLAWGGTHTWLVRGIARLPLIVLFCLIAGRGAAGPKRKVRSTASTRLARR